MQAMALAVAGSQTFRHQNAPAATREPATDGITLGFSTYGMKALKTEEALREIQRIGYDAVELTVWPDWDAAPGNMSAARRQTIRKQLQASYCD